jgi:hypothetical protein
MKEIKARDGYYLTQAKEVEDRVLEQIVVYYEAGLL